MKYNYINLQNNVLVLLVLVFFSSTISFTQVSKSDEPSTTETKQDSITPSGYRYVSPEKLAEINAHIRKRSKQLYQDMEDGIIPVPGGHDDDWYEDENTSVLEEEIIKVEKEYDLSIDIGVDTIVELPNLYPWDPNKFDSGNANDEVYVPITGNEITDPVRVSDKETIENSLTNIKAQLSSQMLTPEQRNELTEAYYDAIYALSEMQSQQIYLDYTANTIFTGSDQILTYNPIVGVPWTAGKVVYDLAKGKWVSAALNATTTLGKVVVSGKVIINNAGQMIQLTSDYYKIASVIAGAGDTGDTGDIGGTYSKWGNYGNWGTQSTPGTPEPIQEGYDK